VGVRDQDGGHALMGLGGDSVAFHDQVQACMALMGAVEGRIALVGSGASKSMILLLE